MIKKYGSDDHEATRKMLEEINIEEGIIGIILAKSFGNSVATKNSDNWYLKILFYADMRVLPDGVGTLEERIEDVRTRMPKYANRPDFPDLVAACREIEGQIQQKMNVSVSEISDQILIDSVK